MPNPDLVQDLRLPTNAIYDSSLPPLKRIKTATSSALSHVHSVGSSGEPATGSRDSLKRGPSAMPEPIPKCARTASRDSSAPPRIPRHTSDTGDAPPRADYPFPLPCRRIDFEATVQARSAPSVDHAVRVSCDGSFFNRDDSSVAGWGFTVCSAGFEFLLDFCGPLQLNPLHPCNFGVSRATNNTAELVALLVAFKWVALFAHGQSVLINYDSSYAANLIQRIWRPSSNFSVVLAARASYDAACQVARISWEHIDSHTGDFLNERADSLAKHGALVRYPRSSVHSHLAQMGL